MSRPSAVETNAANPFFRSRRVPLSSVGRKRAAAAPADKRRHRRRRRLKKSAFVFLLAALAVVFVGAVWYAKSQDKTEPAAAPAAEDPLRLIQPD